MRVILRKSTACPTIPLKRKLKISPEDKCSGYIRKVKKMDKILSLLENDAKLTPEQLAVMLGKETGDIKRAIEEYEREGVILGYQALVDWDKTDREYVTALIEVKITPQPDLGFDKAAEKNIQLSRSKKRVSYVGRVRPRSPYRRQNNA